MSRYELPSEAREQSSVPRQALRLCPRLGGRTAGRWSRSFQRAFHLGRSQHRHRVDVAGQFSTLELNDVLVLLNYGLVLLNEIVKECNLLFKLLIAQGKMTPSSCSSKSFDWRRPAGLLECEIPWYTYNWVEQENSLRYKVVQTKKSCYLSSW